MKEALKRKQLLIVVKEKIINVAELHLVSPSAQLQTMCQNMNKNTLILCLLPIIVGAHLSVRYQSVKDSVSTDGRSL